MKIVKRNGSQVANLSIVFKENTMNWLTENTIYCLVIPKLSSLLEKVAKKLRSKPIQNTPRMALRSPLDGLFVISGTGIPIVLYKWRDYGRKRSFKYPVRTY